MDEEKHVIIQKRIDEVMSLEFKKMITEYSKDPLLELIFEEKIDKMSLAKIKEHLEKRKI